MDRLPNRGVGRLDGWAGVLAAAVFIALVVAFYPFADVFEFDPDEGISMLKAMMLAQGHAMFSEIRSDQPPLFTHMLVAWCKAWGWSTYVARLLVLLFGAAIIFAVYDALRLLSGHVAAMAGACLLAASVGFVRLSVSAMLGLPALSLATLSCWALVRWSYAGGGLRWCVVSGALIGASLMTKLFAAFVAPVLGAWLLVASLRSKGRGWSFDKASLLPPLTWGLAALGIVAAVVLLMIPLSSLGDLFGIHVAARAADSFYTAQGQGYLKVLHELMVADWWLFSLAALGAVVGVLSRRWTLLMPAAWCLLGYLLLRQHRPIWYHHFQLLSIPAAMLAGAAVGAALPRALRLASPGTQPERPERLRPTPRRALGGLVALLLVWLAVDVARGSKRFGPKANLHHQGASDRFVAEVMRSYAPATKAAIVDRQMYAFAAGIKVPPEFCVTSLKQLRTTELPEQLIRFVEQKRPEQVAISSFRFGRLRRLVAGLLEAMGEDYRLVYVNPRGSLRLYVREDVAGDPIEALRAALERQPGYAGGLHAIGLHLNRQGKHPAALEAFGAALERDPGFWQAHRDLADTLLATGRLGEGFAALQRASAGEGTLVPPLARHYAWRRASVASAKWRDPGEALRALTAASAKVRRPADLSILAAIHAAKGQFDKAVATIDGLKDPRFRQGSLGRRLAKQRAVYIRRRVWAPRIEAPHKW